jgi:thymidine phosphorylase
MIEAGSGRELSTAAGRANHSTLRARRIGVHTQHEAVVFMRTDCHVCRSEGLASHSRVLLQAGAQTILATLYQVSSALIAVDEAGLSEAAWQRLGVAEGDLIFARHPEPVDSMGKVRGRIFGHRFDEESLRSILRDVVAGRYSDIELSAFVTACSALPLDQSEITALTRVMVDIGERLDWRKSPVVDKHSVGGLPGNRTTPIVVAIVAAHGLTMPKTSSRAITSPAGTADTMETLAPVDLDVPAIRRVVEQENGCVVWGGAVRLSPADDMLIRIERALDIDSEGQLIASVLSKKVAAGASHLVLDIPVGPTAKVRSAAAAEGLSQRLLETASAFGIKTAIVFSDGLQPVGRGIGPALEARDILAVLQRAKGAPEDLRERACRLAGALLELGGRAASGQGMAAASEIIDDGRAWAKFQRICEAQGGMRIPPVAAERRPLLAPFDGRVRAIDNRKISKLAKLAGAPDTKAAGVELHVRLGEMVVAGEPLCTVHADTQGELQYAFDFASANEDIVAIERF